MSGALSKSESKDLAACEYIISQGLGVFVEVGSALLAIRDGRLYRTEHATFEDYCRERWAMSRQHANRLIAASEAMTTLEPMGSIPDSERVARPLAQLEPELQRAAWEKAVDAAPNGKPTAKGVEAAVREVAGDAKPGPAPKVVLEKLLDSILSTMIGVRRFGLKSYVGDKSPEARERVVERIDSLTDALAQWREELLGEA